MSVMACSFIKHAVKIARGTCSDSNVSNLLVLSDVCTESEERDLRYNASISPKERKKAQINTFY